jgi:hypothetical protein
MPSTTFPNVAFLFLFIAYVIQLLFVLRKLRTEPSALLASSELWIYVGLSLLIPVLIGFLPDLLGHAIAQGVSDAVANARNLATALAKNIPAPPQVQSGMPPATLTVFVGVRLLVAYLTTIVTLELALQAQAYQQNKGNPWFGLLVINLGFDITSIVVFQTFKVFVENTPTDTSMVVFFLMCFPPTLLTGVLVVCGSYSALTRGLK